MFIRKIVFFMICLLLTAVIPASGQKQVPGEGIITDKEIRMAVETRLRLADSVPAHLIDVESNDRKVVLSGSVDNILAREQATRIARTVKGVKSVVNRMDVSPVSLTDNQIRERVIDILFRGPATDAAEIDVAVQDGNVTLKGQVDSWQEKRLVEKRSKSVKGVVGVRNEVIVSPDLERPDQEIEAEIRQALDWDAWIDAGLVRVSVEDGVVSLVGTVGSAIEKRRAYEKAFVAGVENVDTSALEVDWAVRDEMRRLDKMDIRSDQTVAKAIFSSFRYSPWVSRSNVEVDVDNGVVVLSGKVDSLKTKYTAEQIAQNTTGVWRVKNHLRVRPETGPAEAGIIETISDIYSDDPYLAQRDISMLVNNGKLFLYGTVDSRFERKRAAEMASEVQGVIDVANNLTVQQTERATDQDDWEVKEDVREQMEWSPYVDSERIKVTVEDGVVSLTGTVYNWQARKIAELNAYEAGADRVRNLLDVEYGPM